MHIYFKKMILLFAILVTSTSFAMAPLVAAGSATDKVKDLITSCPWIGLIAKEVTYGPITISKLNMANAGRLVFCEPGEKIKGTLRYKMDASKMDSWEFHHIIIGIRDHNAQKCITHSLGLWDRSGKASFSFNAPLEKGIYEICFDYHETFLCSDALSKWQESPPSTKTTIGILVVD